MGIGALGAGVIAHRQMANLTHQAALLRGQAVLDALAVPAAVSIATNDYTKLDSFVAELERAQRGELLLLVVVDHEGRLMATSQTGFVGGEESSFSPEFTKAAISEDKGWFAFHPSTSDPIYLDMALPIRQGQRWGTVMARFSLASLRREQATLTRMIALVILAAAMIGWTIATLVLDRLVLAPTHRLADMARRLGEGDLDVRTSVVRRDEIGALATALNDMAEQLQKHTHGLERAVKERTSDLEAANRELERLATTDSLTNLKNVRFFQDRLSFEVQRSQRHPHRLSVCMFDLDHFKEFNDTHGHPAGDRLLRDFSALLCQHTRAIDVLARYGGEEFILLLLDTGRDEAIATAEKLVTLVREHPFGGGDQPIRRVTVSAGVASFPDEAESPEQLVEYADRALYEAKRLGRDQSVQFSRELLHRPSFEPQDRFHTQDLVPRPLPEKEV